MALAKWLNPDQYGALDRKRQCRRNCPGLPFVAGGSCFAVVCAAGNPSMIASTSGRLAMRGTLYLAMFAAAASLGGSALRDIRHHFAMAAGPQKCQPLHDLFPVKRGIVASP